MKTRSQPSPYLASVLWRGGVGFSPAPVVHVIPCDAPRVSRREVRSRCCLIVADVPWQPPTCPQCLRLDAADAAAIEALKEESDAD